jgi:hypothetical protein
MYYEGRISTTFQIDKDEILSVLNETGKELKHVKRKDGTPQNATLYSEVLFIFEHNGKKYGFANDESTCEGITELAILDIDNMTQIESLTLGWVKGNKAKAVLDCCDNPFSQQKTGIMLDEKFNIIKQPLSYYTCGCCGAGFKSTHKEQSKFDQDSGYGICIECEK